jgi:asparagine synthetase A
MIPQNHPLDSLKTLKSKLPNVTKRRRNRAITEAYHALGIAIDVMDIGKVLDEGHRLLEAGANEAELRAGLLAFVTQNLAKDTS